MRRAQVSVPGVGYSTCHVYEDRTPILELASETAVVTFGPAARDTITAEEEAFGRELAANAGRYAQECTRFAEQMAYRLGGGAAERVMKPARGRVR